MQVVRTAARGPNGSYLECDPQVPRAENPLYVSEVVDPTYRGIGDYVYVQTDSLGKDTMLTTKRQDSFDASAYVETSFDFDSNQSVQSTTVIPLSQGPGYYPTNIRDNAGYETAPASNPNRSIKNSSYDSPSDNYSRLNHLGRTGSDNANLYAHLSPDGRSGQSRSSLGGADYNVLGDSFVTSQPSSNYDSLNHTTGIPLEATYDEVNLLQTSSGNLYAYAELPTIALGAVSEPAPPVDYVNGLMAMRAKPDKTDEELERERQQQMAQLMKLSPLAPRTVQRDE